MIAAIGHNSPPGVQFHPMIPVDALDIQRQASQRIQLGMVRDMTYEEAHDLANGGEAWTAWQGGRIVACIGLRETFPDVQAVAWAIIATGIGTAHLAVTRFARARIAASALVRIEAIVRADVAAECVWAKLVGLRAAHVLEKFGAASERHILFERLK